MRPSCLSHGIDRERNRSKISWVKSTRGRFEQVAPRLDVNRVYVEPFDPRERGQMIVPVAVPVVGVRWLREKALHAVPRLLGTFDHRHAELAPLGVVHERRELLLLDIPAETPTVSVLLLCHDGLANVPAFSCGRQSDGGAGATAPSAATPC